MKYIVIMLSVLFNIVAVAQGKYQGLKVGDRLPEILTVNLMGPNSKSLDLNSLKGKVIVLDFWATWCAPCIKAMPFLDSLQRKYREQLFVLPVTDEDQKTVVKCLNKTPLLSNVHLSFAIKDNILRVLFPHTGLPHDVIIDQHGVVKAITSFDEITDSLLSKVIANQQITVKAKTDRGDFNPFLPHFLKNDLDSCKLSFMITGYINGVLSTHSTPPKPAGKSSATSYRLAATNATRADLFRLALNFGSGSTYDLSDQQIIYKGVNKKEFFYPKEASIKEQYGWTVKNCFCAELIVPPTIDIHDYFKQQLELYFNVTSKRQDINADCYVLKCIDSTLLLSKTAAGNAVYDEGKTKWTLKHAKLKRIIGIMNSFSDYPIIDDTGLKNPTVDLYFSPAKINNLNEFNAELKAQGLIVSKERRTTTFMVIEENGVKE